MVQYTEGVRILRMYYLGKKNRTPLCCDVVIYLENIVEGLKTESLFLITFLGFHYSQFWF